MTRRRRRRRIADAMWLLLAIFLSFELPSMAFARSRHKAALSSSPFASLQRFGPVVFVNDDEVGSESSSIISDVDGDSESNSLQPGPMALAAVDSDVDFGHNISRLLGYLMHEKGYDKRLRPNYKGRPVEVAISMFISGVSHVSEVNMDVTLDFYFRQYWQDNRLSFDGLWDEEVVVGGEFLNEIWRPDTFFVNAKHASFHHVTMINTFLRITPSGNVTQSIRLTVTASCPMDFTYFPMDSQRCTLEIESYGYTTRDIAYRWARKRAVSFAPEVQLPQFRVRGHREVHRHIELSSGNYSRLAVEVYFERSLGYYLIQVYIPSVLIVMLSLVSFWIKRESAPARVSLGITTVLTMTTLISSTNASLPKISYLKAIDVYLVSCFIMVFAALLEYAAVAYTEKRCKMFQIKTGRLIDRQLDDAAMIAAAAGEELPTPRGPIVINTGIRQRSSAELMRNRLENQQFFAQERYANMPNRRPRYFSTGLDDLASSELDEGLPLPTPISQNLTNEKKTTQGANCFKCSCEDAKASDIEKYSRIVFPTAFTCFNILYWITYLNISVITDEDGFIPAETA